MFSIIQIQQSASMPSQQFCFTMYAPSGTAWSHVCCFSIVCRCYAAPAKFDRAIEVSWAASVVMSIQQTRRDVISYTGVCASC